MPDYLPAATAAAEAAIFDELRSSREVEPDRLAKVALDAAAPLLAEAVAQKILAHMETRGPRKPQGPLETSLHGIGGAYRTWRRYMGIAARIAAAAFDTREDQLRKAAEAIERGDFIACAGHEVPGA